MGSLAGAALGGVASIAGGMLSGNAQKDAAERAAAAAQFNPYNVTGPGGSAIFNGDSVNISMDPNSEAMRNSLMGLGTGGLAGIDPRLLQSITQSGMGAQIAGAPMVMDQTQGFLNQSAAGDQALQGLFSQYGDQLNPIAAQGMGMGALGQQAMMGAFGPGRADDIANFAAQQGAGLLGQNFGDVQASELARMRAQAQPGNERAVDSALTGLFTSGRLGMTGGANMAGRLAEAQNQQDLGFQGASTATAQNLLNSARASGTNLLGMGQQGLLSGQANNAGFASALGGLGQAGMGMASNAYGNLFNAGTGLQDALASRAMQRVGAAQNLFGFGQNVTNNTFNQAQQGLNATLAQDQAARQMAALGGNLGSSAASAGANQANYINQTGTSPLGAGLMGLGGGMLNAGVKNLFSAGGMFGNATSDDDKG